jgi:predicted CopG family antitoxin
MATRSVELDEDLYRRIEAHRRDTETFSDAIERLISGPSLSDLGGILDDEQVEGMRTAIERTDTADAEAVAELAERFE